MLSALPVTIDGSAFKGSLRRSVYDKDSDCWSEPGGKGFMVRGRTYNDDSLKVGNVFYGSVPFCTNLEGHDQTFPQVKVPDERGTQSFESSFRLK